MSLVGCAFQPKSGRVVDSWHVPEMFVMVPVCSGNPMICNNIMVWQPEGWRLKIESDEPDHVGKHGFRDVSHAVYDRCWPEDHFPDCGARGR
jgi:hypothetical protein